MIRHRSLRRPQGERQAHGHGERGDVVKEDDRIDAEASRQERRLGGQLDILGEFVEGQAGTEAVELRVPAAGLPHGPDRRTFDAFAARGTHQQV